MKKILIPLLVFFAILFVLTSFSSFKPYLKKSESVSPNILFLTQPVTSFSGKVENIEGNKIFVSFPTSKATTISYLVTITGKTQISRFQPPSPVVTTAAKLTVKDIKVGQIITVSTINDLRTMTGNTFEATAVNLPPIANVLNGKIVSLEGNVLTIKGFTPAPMMPPLINPGMAPPNAPQEKEYRITLTPDVEISRISSFLPTKPGEVPQLPKNEKISITDLKKDMQVTVYTDKDVNENSQLTALRIQTIVQP